MWEKLYQKLQNAETPLKTENPAEILLVGERAYVK